MQELSDLLEAFVDLEPVDQVLTDFLGVLLCRLARRAGEEGGGLDEDKLGATTRKSARSLASRCSSSARRSRY